MEKDQNIIGVYHKNCTDGTTAAAVLLTKFPDAKVYPLDHDYTESDIIHILEKITPNSKVYTIDCCLGVYEFLKREIPVTVIDHHISVKNEMEEISKQNNLFTFIFDNNKSGASLAWKYFFPHSTTPQLIELVEAYDIWNEKHGEDSTALSRFLTPLLNQPEKIIPLIENFPKDALEKGSLIVEFEKIRIENFLSNNSPIPLSITEHKIPSYNSPFFGSELGNVLSKKHASTVCIFSIKGDTVRLSFRSKDEQNPSALDIAKILGGGGHRNAAAAKMTLIEFKKLLP